MRSVARFVFLVFLVVCLFVLPRQALAHVLKSDGSIGAVIHISPDDDPIAGNVSNFYFEFKDKKNKFDPAVCECIVTITEGKEEIYSERLFYNDPNPSLSHASFSFTFPKKDIYKVVIKGEPGEGADFDKFTFEYDVRVEREASIIQSGNDVGAFGQSGFSGWVSAHVPHIAVGILSASLLVWVVIKNLNGSKKSHGA